jgi:hypothetical protein
MAMINQLSLSRPDSKLRGTRDEFKAEFLNGFSERMLCAGSRGRWHVNRSVEAAPVHRFAFLI